MAKQPLGIRLPDILKIQLDQIAQTREITTNQLIVQALAEWYRTIIFTQQLRFMTITKDFFTQLLTCLNADQLTTIAHELADLAVEVIRSLVNKPSGPNNIQEFTTILPDFLGDKGLRWFKQFDTRIIDNRVIFSGFHYLGEDFSRLITAMCNYAMTKYFSYTPITFEPSPSCNSIYLEFELK